MFGIQEVDYVGKPYNNLKIHRNLEIAVSGIYDDFFVLEFIPNPVKKIFCLTLGS